MAIEKDYLEIIEELKQNSDKLNDWETKFVFGDGDSLPIEDRPSLSISQKNTLDKMHKERVQNAGRTEVTKVTFKNPRVEANKTETNVFSVSVDDEQLPPTVSYKEAVAIVGWLSDAIETLKPAAAFPGE